MDVHDDSSPPVDFPVYGLDASWRGWRWFEYYQAKSGDRAWAVGLGHRPADGTGGIIISTLRRAHYDMALPRGQADHLVEIAFEGAVRLGNATLPEIDVPRPQDLLKALVGHMQDQSEHYRDWPVASWKVDGNLITGPILNFADGWITFTAAVPEIYVSVLGLNAPLTSSLDVVRIADLREYGLDSKARLSLASMIAAHKQPANTKLPPREFLHPDFHALFI